MINYNEVISQLRELARDVLRLKAVNGLRGNLLEVEKCLTDSQKELARVNFKISKLETENPDYDYLKKDLETQKETGEKCLKSCEESKAKFEKEITEWQSGDKKISAESLETETARLVDVYVAEKVKELE